MLVRCPQSAHVTGSSGVACSPEVTGQSLELSTSPPPPLQKVAEHVVAADHDEQKPRHQGADHPDASEVGGPGCVPARTPGPPLPAPRAAERGSTRRRDGNSNLIIEDRTPRPR